MRQQIRLGDRVLSYLDSAPSASDIGQDFAPATPADAANLVAPRQVLVFIHAFPMNSDMWEAQVAAVPAGWRFLAPDLQGFGRTAAATTHVAGGRAPDAASPDDYARDVLALLDHLGVDAAVVAGLSMGGYTAFALVRLAASRVQGLVLANTKADTDSTEARKARADMLDLLAREGVAAVADRMLPRLLGETSRMRRPAVVQRVRTIALANSAEGVRGAIVRMTNRPDSTPLLPRIQCPTLVIASDEDAVTPADRAHEMLEAIPGAQLATIHGAGHLSNMEQPGDFNLALQRFLAQHFRG